MFDLMDGKKHWLFIKRQIERGGGVITINDMVRKFVILYI